MGLFISLLCFYVMNLFLISERATTGNLISQGKLTEQVRTLRTVIETLNTSKRKGL